jgi:site-specific DNA-methyltransferase (adenine-specific)
MKPEKLFGGVRLYCGDCMKVLARLKDNSVDSVVTDPPYHLTSILKRFAATSEDDDNKTGRRSKARADGYARLARGFMGKQWDGGSIAFKVELWKEVFRVLKPGGHLLSFGGTRTYHRMACAIEDAGFDIRDQVQWMYGSGFPKSHDIAKNVDKELGAKRGKVRVENPRNPKTTGCGRDGVKGATRPFIEKAIKKGYHEIDDDTPITKEAKEWDGWGTALKPANEPIVLARKPLSEKTVAANVLRWRTGALNIDGCLVEGNESTVRPINNIRVHGGADGGYVGQRGNRPCDGRLGGSDSGRWPANVAHDGSEEVVGMFPQLGKSTGGRIGNAGGGNVQNIPTGRFSKGDPGYGDSGSAARFFYSSKADSDDRFASKHPTVKPVDLMRWLVRLVTPPGGVVLDPFAGTGTTGEAAFREDMRAVLIERETEYQDDIRRRMRFAKANPDDRAYEIAKVSGELSRNVKQFKNTWGLD